MVQSKSWNIVYREEREEKTRKKKKKKSIEIIKNSIEVVNLSLLAEYYFKKIETKKNKRFGYLMWD